MSARVVFEAPGMPQPGFGALTYPSYRRLLDVPAGEGGLPVTAKVDNRPVGLLLSRIETSGRATLLSVAVDPRYRRRGVARRLLERLEGELAERGVALMETFYTTRSPAMAGFEQWLTATGWGIPENRAVYGLVRVLRAARAAWLQRIPPLERDFEVVAWPDLPETARQEIQAGLERDEVPAQLDPFHDPENLEPASSLVACRKGAVAGWIVHHRIPAMPGVLRYSRLYGRPGYRMRGVSMRLWHAGLQRHLQRLSGTYPKLLMDVPYEYRNQAATFHRRFKPYMDQVYHARRAEKAIPERRT